MTVRVPGRGRSTLFVTTARLRSPPRGPRLAPPPGVDLFREGTPGHWLWIALAAWAGLVVLGALTRSLYEILYYGPRAYLRQALRVDTGTWWLLAVLVFIGIAGMTVWIQWL